MSSAFIFGVGFTLLAAWTLTVHIEERRRGRLFLQTARAKFDSGLRLMSEWTHDTATKHGRGAVRQSIHFIVHRCLQLLLLITRANERVLRRLQQRNKQAAKRDLEAADPYFEEVKAHHDSVRLSEEDARKKRRALLK